jgi:hypothetical protein
MVKGSKVVKEFKEQCKQFQQSMGKKRLAKATSKLELQL